MSARTHALAPLAAGLVLAFNVAAQDHSGHQPAPTAAQQQSSPTPSPMEPEAHDHAGHAADAVQPTPPPQDHSAHEGHEGHDATPPPAVDHDAMGHDATGHDAMGHDATGHDATGHDATGHEAMGHEAMGHEPSTPTPGNVDHAAMGHDAHATGHAPVTPVPAPTDAERAAAVRPTGGHAMHDNARQHFVLVDRLEAFDADAGHGVEWEVQAWAGTDLHKLWLRSEGEEVDGHTEDADLEVLYGRSVAPWWDVVAGVRHHFEPGGSQDMLVLGVMGLAPYKFEVDASLYLGESGYTGARLEVEYEALLTNRLVLQPALEVNLHGQDDAAHGNAEGLGTVEFGLRLRYEITRQFAPYIGLVRERAYGGTADLRREEGEDVDDSRIVAGVRVWF